MRVFVAQLGGAFTLVVGLSPTRDKTNNHDLGLI